MKKIVALSVAVLFILYGCQSEESYVEEQPTKNEAILNIPENHRIVIEALGLDISSLIDEGTDYRLEGDIMLSKNDIDEYLVPNENGKLKQSYVKNRLLDLSPVPHFTIRVDESIPQSGAGADWRQAVIDAVDAWNSISGTCLKFTYTTDKKASITVTRTFENSNSIAWTWLPSFGSPKSQIYVNSKYDDNYPQKANTITHEIGHSIGLLHAHESASSQGGIVVPGTPDTDDESIMSYYRDKSRMPGFSNNDLIAIRRLYPAQLPILKCRLKRIDSLGNTYTAWLENLNLDVFSEISEWRVSGGDILDGFNNTSRVTRKFSHRVSFIIRKNNNSSINHIRITARQDGRIIAIHTNH